MIKKLLNRNKKIPTSKGETPQKAVSPTSPSTQNWLPVNDVNDRFIYRKDGHIVTAIRIQPVNLHLLSEKEQKNKIASLHEVTNGIDYETQTLVIARPVDLDGYIARLEVMKDEETNFIKKRLLDGYIRQAAQLATGGEALERHFYMLLTQKLTKKVEYDKNELLARTNQLALNLSGAGLASHICSDQELRDVLFIFTNPQQAAYERAPYTSSEVVQAVYTGGN